MSCWPARSCSPSASWSRRADPIVGRPTTTPRWPRWCRRSRRSSRSRCSRDSSRRSSSSCPSTVPVTTTSGRSGGGRAALRDALHRLPVRRLPARPGAPHRLHRARPRPRRQLARRLEHPGRGQHAGQGPRRRVRGRHGDRHPLQRPLLRRSRAVGQRLDDRGLVDRARRSSSGSGARTATSPCRRRPSEVDGRRAWRAGRSSCGRRSRQRVHLRHQRRLERDRLAAQGPVGTLAVPTGVRAAGRARRPARGSCRWTTTSGSSRPATHRPQATPGRTRTRCCGRTGRCTGRPTPATGRRWCSATTSTPGTATRTRTRWRASSRRPAASRRRAACRTGT